MWQDDIIMIKLKKSKLYFIAIWPHASCRCRVDRAAARPSNPIRDTSFTAALISQHFPGFHLYVQLLQNLVLALLPLIQQHLAMSLPNRPSLQQPTYNTVLSPLQQPTYSTVLSPAASGLGCQQANPKQPCSQPNREIAVHSGSNQTLPSSSYKDSSRTFISIHPA